MSPDKVTTPTKVCPTCGTRVSETATRCQVCGRVLTPAAKTRSGSDQSISGPRMPTVTLSLPVMIGLLFVILGAGGGAVFAFTRPTPTPPPGAILPTATFTITPTPSLTFTSTSTGTPLPPTSTPTPQDYVVKQNDTCLGIAIAFKVGVSSIVQLNSATVNADCTNLSPGQHLLIPYPTPTNTPQPTSTANSAQATQSSCDTVDYTVQSGDTLGKIEANYNVPAQAIKDWNGMTSDTVYVGNVIKIPLCKRFPTPGPTSTPTPPPPYPPANLLLPADGASFISAGDVITLQWSAVGTLRSNELYAITIEDLTAGNGQKAIDYVNDTKYIVPASLRPSGPMPHVFRWTIIPVRQNGSTKDNQPIYVQAGQPSDPRVFSWLGGSVAATTPTP
jgi:LysM repeat protein